MDTPKTRHAYHDLALDRRTERDRCELVQLVQNVRVDPRALKVPAASPTLAHHTFGRAVEGEQFDAVKGGAHAGTDRASPETERVW